MPLVDLRDFSVSYAPGRPVFDPLSLTLEAGERVGIAGESGCGKSTLLKAAVGLLPPSATSTGHCTLGGRPGYIPQQALASLSPYLTVGDQINELTRSEPRTSELLALVGLPGSRFLHAYPHQLSGGERQRILAVQALAPRSGVIVADEPTANLDPDREAELLALLDRHARDTGAALLVASHRESVFRTLGCRVHHMTPDDPPPLPVSSTPRLDAPPLVEVRGLTKTYRRRDWLTRSRPVVRALDAVSLHIATGECVLLYGPSGAGKSTLARCLMGRETWDSGAIQWHGPRHVQLVQQEPSESLNPRMSVREALLEACGTADPAWLEQIRLPSAWIDRRTIDLSEGQRARIAILRAAAALSEGLLILDESLSGLDPATRGHIVAFLKERKLTLLVITHDLEVAAGLNARVVRL